MYLPSKEGYTIKKVQKRTYLMMIMRFFFIFFIKADVVGTHLNCIDVDAIQMSTHNTCFYKEVRKKIHWL